MSITFSKDDFKQVDITKFKINVLALILEISFPNFKLNDLSCFKRRQYFNRDYKYKSKYVN